jgi:hypothetical protein
MNRVTRGSPPGWRFGKGLTIVQVNKKQYVMLHMAMDLVGSCEYSNEPSGSIKGWEFLE